MKPSIRNHLIYHWWKYLAVVIAVVAFWLYLFGVLAKPRANEKIKITFVGNDLRNIALQDDIKNDITNLQGGQKIEEVGVECLYSEDSYTLNTILTTRVTSDTDIVILKESTLKDFEIESYFVNLNSEFIAEYFGEAQTYQKGGKIYGIILNGDNNRFSKYYSGDENCYAFVTGASENFGGINGKGNSDDKVCINLINYLLGVKE